MALMCKMSKECVESKGMCKHEKMMAGIVVLMVIGFAVYKFAL